ncbi:hypothetical protein [Roseitranquillus sediminis]|uniref:hypothetical protein n=1 Tax=Roseitranquillus sediminis TaxID=2809051 RepID=UPI001D0C1101|nr:hypothetical protein [Roseitranquillus sediminis]MBM9596444.1 hypothetical protein [Roseitranquillus sediminis]
MPNTVADVAHRYLASLGFRELSQSYQAVRRRGVRRLLDLKGGAIARLPFKSLKEPHIRKHLDAMNLNPANKRLKTWRAISDFAKVNGIISSA